MDSASFFLSAIIPKEGNLMFQQKRWSRAQVQTEMVEFIALPFPSSKKKKKKFVISRRSRCRDGTKCTKKRDARAELLFCQLNPLLFDVSDARRRHSFIVRERRTREEEQVQYYSLILQSVCYHGVALTTIYMVNQCSETTLILRLPLCLFNRHVK